MRSETDLDESVAAIRPIMLARPSRRARIRELYVLRLSSHKIEEIFLRTLDTCKYIPFDPQHISCSYHRHPKYRARRQGQAIWTYGNT